MNAGGGVAAKGTVEAAAEEQENMQGEHRESTKRSRAGGEQAEPCSVPGHLIVSRGVRPQREGAGEGRGEGDEGAAGQRILSLCGFPFPFRLDSFWFRARFD